MKEKKEAKAQKVQKAQDIITNRVLIFFGFTAIFLWAISYLNRAFDYPSSFQAANVAAVIMMVVGAAAVVAGLVWQRARVRSGKAQDAALSGYVVVWFGLVLALSCAMMMFYSYTLAMRLLYVLMPVSAVLYLIYYVYPREFFTVLPDPCIPGLSDVGAGQDFRRRRRPGDSLCVLCPGRSGLRGLRWRWPIRRGARAVCSLWVHARLRCSTKPPTSAM